MNSRVSARQRKAMSGQAAGARAPNASPKSNGHLTQQTDSAATTEPPSDRTEAHATGGTIERREDGSLRCLDKAGLLKALLAFKKGDFSARLPVDLEGVDGKIADAFNDVIERNQSMARELERLSHVVGKEGKINQRANAIELKAQALADGTVPMRQYGFRKAAEGITTLEEVMTVTAASE